jgi:O-succinylbenzoic acid--CoA ligase
LGQLVNNQISNEVVFLGINDEKLGQKLVLLIEGNECDEIKINYLPSFIHQKTTSRKKSFLKKNFLDCRMGKLID